MCRCRREGHCHCTSWAFVIRIWWSACLDLFYFWLWTVGRVSVCSSVLSERMFKALNSFPSVCCHTGCLMSRNSSACYFSACFRPFHRYAVEGGGTLPWKQKTKAMCKGSVRWREDSLEWRCVCVCVCQHVSAWWCDGSLALKSKLFPWRCLQETLSL